MLRELREVVGHAGVAAAPADRGDWTIDQRWDAYTAAEHATWKNLFTRQSALLPGRACDEFIAGLHALPIEPDAIPDFRRLSDVLARHTGWEIVAVRGLVPDEVFFEHLANRRFPAGHFIRKQHELDYLEEPDIFHDVFGHVPMLMNPVIADFVQAYGVGGLRASRLGALEQLARVYWFTIEFGLVRQHGALRIYGSGIVSSHGETRFALVDDSPNRIAFDLLRVMRTRYRIDDFQQTYFVVDSLDALLQLAHIDFAPLYGRVRGLPELKPDDVVAEDIVVSHGTGRHHRKGRP